MVIVALFVTKTGNNLDFPTGEWLNKMVYPYYGTL